MGGVRRQTIRLVIAKRHNSVPHPDATRWLGGLDDVLYARVAALGLCQPRESAAVVTLDELLKRIDAAASVRDGTRTTYRQAFTMLRAHFGESMPIDSITPAHADEWRKAIAEPKQAGKGKPAKALAPATVAKRVKVAKAVFAKAMKWGMIASNPFADVRAGSQSSPDSAAGMGPNRAATNPATHTRQSDTTRDQRRNATEGDDAKNRDAPAD